MAVITFDVVAFRASYPQFANPTKWTNAALQGYFDTAICIINNNDYGCGSLTGACRVRALNLETAHLAALADIIASGQTPGLVNSATVDRVSVSLTPPPTLSSWRYWLSLTPYGLQLLAILSSKSVGGYYIGGNPEVSAFRRPFRNY